MSGGDAAKEMKAVLRRNLPAPPARDETFGNLREGLPRRGRGRPSKPGKIVQLNLRVPEDVKDRLRLLAARDRRDMSRIVVEALELYEEKFGAAPAIERHRAIG